MLCFAEPLLSQCAAVQELVARADSRSCQHGFASIFCLREQYGTELCIENDVLYLRSTRRRAGEVTYFPPVGAGAALSEGFARIEQTAAAEGRPWSFFALTADDVETLQRIAPGRYRFTELPGWAEYLYDVRPLATLEGSTMAKKRHDASICLRLYGDKMTLEPIGPDNADEVAAFHRYWMKVCGESKEFEGHLSWETRGVMEALAHFEALGLRGMLLRIDGAPAAYSYGCVVGRDTFDIIAQKADYRFRNLYRIIFKELVARCAADCRFVNCEEDLGLPGLRRLKESYHPAFLLRKWSAVREEGSV